MRLCPESPTHLAIIPTSRFSSWNLAYNGRLGLFGWERFGDAQTNVRLVVVG